MKRTWAVVGALLLCASGAASSGAFAAPIEASVARIINYAQRPNWWAPWDMQPTRAGSGSGFVVSGKKIMTNAHVVSDARLLMVFLNNDPNPHPAKVAVIGHDCDLAVLELADPSLLDKIPPLEFGGLPALRSTVETYGYPAGGAQLSSTRGVVSRIETQGYAHSSADAHLAVQTDAAINPGNSGGPVIQDGKVVGVAFQGAQALQGVGFFIPVEVIRHFLDDVADGKYDGYPDLGVERSAMESPARRKRMGMADGESGIYVETVWPGSSAEGILRKGDVLLAAQGRVVANDGSVEMDGMRFSVGRLFDLLQVGEKLKARILRDGKRLDVEIPMKLLPGRERRAFVYDRKPRYFVHGGLVFAPLEMETLRVYGDNWAQTADKELLREIRLGIYETPELYGRERIVLLRKLDAPVNAQMSLDRPMLVETIDGKRIDRLEDVVAAFEGDKSQFVVIQSTRPEWFVVLDRKQADEQNDEILAAYGVPKDRNL